MWFLVDIENNYLILCQFGYFLSRIQFLRYLTSMFQGFDLDLRLSTFDLQRSSEVKKYAWYSSSYIRLPIWLLLTLSLYLIRFWRYSTSKFLGFDLHLWPLEVTWGQIYFHFSKAHAWLPIQLLLTLHLFLVSLYRTVFEIFDLKVLGVCPWPLTFRGHLGVKNAFNIWKIIHDFLSNFYWHFLSLFHTIFKMFEFKVFRVWPWPLAFRDHLRAEVKNMFTIREPIHDFLSNIYWHFLSISFRLFIFDFKVFRVWPWPSTFRGHLRSKICSPFESPCMISYLTSNDTFSLSRAVFKIFDFKVLRVWPWPLSFRGHLRAEVTNMFPIRKPIHDFLSNSYWHILSISYRYFKYLSSKFLGFDLDLWPSEVTWVQKYVHNSKAYIWLPI